MFCAWAEAGKWTHRSSPHVPLRSCLAGRSLLCIQDLRHSDVLPSSVPEVQLVSRNLQPQMQFALELWSERKAPRTPGTWEDQQTTCGRPGRARLEVACRLHVVISFRVRLGSESEILAGALGHSVFEPRDKDSPWPRSAASSTSPHTAGRDP